MMMYKFKQKIKIGDKFLGKGEKCFIVAEVGLNHNGDIEIAKKLIDKAIECEVDAVKFQKRNLEKILTKEALYEPYNKTYAYGRTYGDHRKALEFSEDEFRELKSYSDERGILFFASPWDEESADFLEALNILVYKITSADLINTPLIESIAKKGKPLILSTGMSTMEEINEAVNTVSLYNDELILLHCVSTYPSEHQEINLRNLETLRKTFNCIIGYSGHERGLSISEAACALGAKLIERHFTLDRTMKGPDHAASLEPPGLCKLVRDIRNIEISMGSFKKKIQKREIEIRKKLAKSVVATVDIPQNTVITRDMLTIKGPGYGLPPKYVKILPGNETAVDIKADTIITVDMVNFK